MWLGQPHQGLMVRHPNPPPPLVSAFASRVPGLGTAPAPVPAPFGLAPMARTGSTDFAFGPVRKLDSTASGCVYFSRSFAASGFAYTALGTVSTGVGCLLGLPPVLQSRGTYQVPSLADLDLAGYALSTPGPLQLQGLVSATNQSLMPRVAVPAPQVVGMRDVGEAGMSGSTQSSRHQAAWWVGDPSTVAGGSCIGGLCKPCCGADSGL